MDEYVVMAWSLFTFIAGTGTGVWLSRKLSGATASGPLTPRLSRPGFAWARSDIVIPAPTVANTMVRNVSTWQDDGAIDLKARTFTFHVYDNRTDLDRDITVSAHKLLTFFKCDTPKRSEWRGDVKLYTLLLAVGVGYHWLMERDTGNGYEWAIDYSTRERRLRKIQLWLSR